MTVHSRATFMKHQSCHLFALSLINTHKRREDFTAENINNILRESDKIGLSIYKSIHKTLHKAGTYLTLMPEHYWGCQGLFPVLSNGTERQSCCAVLNFWLPTCVLVPAQAKRLRGAMGCGGVLSTTPDGNPTGMFFICPPCPSLLPWSLHEKWNRRAQPSWHQRFLEYQQDFVEGCFLLCCIP